MFTKSKNGSGGQQPHVRYLKKALKSLRIDKSLIQLSFEACNDSFCDASGPRRSSMTDKLPGWRATFRKLMEKHENYRGDIPDQACDHLFIYLDTRNFTNKPILSDSDDDDDDESEQSGVLYEEELPHRLTQRSSSDSKEEFDRQSMIRQVYGNAGDNCMCPPPT